MYCDDYDNGMKISFKQFLSFYYIAPEKWFIDNRVPVYVKEGTVKGEYDRCGRIRESNLVRFEMSFFSQVKFKIWKIHIKREEEKRKSNERMAEFLSLVKKDVDKCAKDAESKILESQNSLIDYIYRPELKLGTESKLEPEPEPKYVKTQEEIEEELKKEKEEQEKREKEAAERNRILEEQRKREREKEEETRERLKKEREESKQKWEELLEQQRQFEQEKLQKEEQEKRRKEKRKMRAKRSKQQQ